MKRFGELEYREAGPPAAGGDIPPEVAAALLRPVGWRAAGKRFFRNRMALAGAVFLALAYLGAVFGPLVSPYSPEAIDPAEAFAPPTLRHPLGTDEHGRDVATRLAYGARASLTVGLLSMGLAVCLGTLLGALSGYLGGWADAAIMRVVDAAMALPAFFLVLTFLAVFGGGLVSVILVIGFTSWMGVARVVRSEFLRTRGREFVEAARALGAGDLRVAVRHVLPQALPSVMVSASLGVASAILVESALSYLGLGVQPPTPSWGNMLMNSRQYMWTAPRLAVYPGVLILLTVLSYNFLGDGLRDALDPYLRD
ncbi:MAG: ABC transporter permease [Acetobacteraceae bacterium]|nr:ABC transporter permease [Acetobacteraceae bacterium]